jgi:histidyl-tRNA synthetase
MATNSTTPQLLSHSNYSLQKVGRRQELGYPLRLYSIPNLWRYERPQRGRLREHWQLNVDLFGLAGLTAEHEIIQVADSVLKAYGAKSNMYKIRLNSRKLINHLLTDYFKLDLTQNIGLIRLIDHIEKMEDDKFLASVDVILTPAQREAGLTERIIKLLKVKSIDSLPDEIQGHTSIQELKSLIKLLEQSKIKNVEFDITLMRGFDYYTDIVFEVFDTHPDNNRSMFGGGRYDGLMSIFNVESLPTVGFGMGDVTLENFLEIHELLPELKTSTDLYVVLVGDIYERALTAVGELRDMGLNVAIDSSGNKIDKQIKTALKKNIRYALFIGEDELNKEQYKLKDLKTEIEEPHSLQRIVSIVKDFRQN